MFAFKIHNPYKQTLVGSVEELRIKIDQAATLQTESLNLCDQIEQNWVVFKDEIRQELEESSWFSKFFTIQRNFDSIELFEKHVNEYRAKLKNLKDIRKVIISNLAFHPPQKRQIDTSQTHKEEIGDGNL